MVPNDLAGPWGLVMYKTFYSEQVDAQWPVFLERFKKYVVAGVKDEVTDLTAAEAERVTNNFQFPIFNDRGRFEGKSLDDLRGHFHQWLVENGNEGFDNPEYNLFLTVNEEDFNAVLALPENPSVDTEQWENEGVTLVAAEYDPNAEDNDQGYPGWVKLWLGAVYRLIFTARNAELRHMYPEDTVDSTGNPIWVDYEFGKSR